MSIAGAGLLLLQLVGAFPYGYDSLAVYQVPGPDTVTLITLFSLPPKMLLYRQNSLPGTYLASIRYAVEIRDAGGRVVWSDFSENSWKAQDFEATQGSAPLQLQRIYRLAWSPRYEVQITVQDLNAQRALMSYRLQIATYPGPPYVSDLIPLDPSRFLEGKKVLTNTVRDTGRFLVFVRWREVPDSVYLAWRVDDALIRSQWVSSTGWDTLGVRVDSLAFGAHEVRLRFLDRAGKILADRRLGFQVTGVTHLTEREFAHYLFILTHLFPGDSLLERLKKVNTLRERDSLWMAFWKQRDPTPGTPRNEFLDAFLDRVAYADAHFSVGRIRGSRTDRGLVYIRFGPPDEIEEHTLEWGSKDYQIWYYYDLKLRVVFVDEGGFGDYVLVAPTFSQLFQY